MIPTQRNENATKTQRKRNVLRKVLDHAHKVGTYQDAPYQQRLIVYRSHENLDYLVLIAYIEKELVQVHGSDGLSPV